MAVGWVVSLVMAWPGDGSGPASRRDRGVLDRGGVLADHGDLLPDLAEHAAGRARPGGRRSSVVRDVRDLIRRPGVAVYLASAFGFSLTTPFVYQVIPHYLRRIGMDRAWVASAMSLGQWPEVLGLAVLPFLIRRWGYRPRLMLGVGVVLRPVRCCWRCPSLWVATLGIPLHGVGIACFSIVGQMFINSRASADRRASAQSINTVINGGLGSMTGSLLAGEVVRGDPITRVWSFWSLA